MAKITLYLITGNKHKYEEAREILSHYKINLVMKSFEKMEIQSGDLGEIALKAAQHAYTQIRKPLVVDDSGLFIHALNGFPGPYSSYVYKTIGYEGILKLMENIDDRRACFHTVVALIIPPIEKLFHGETCGEITLTARGTGGFGFDPIFIPEGSNKTYAEMTITEKNRISHRFKAFSALGEWIRKTYEEKIFLH